MAQAVWTGTLTFGLVNIPVKLYTATTPRDVRFRELQRDTGTLVRHLRVGGPASDFGEPEPDPPELDVDEGVESSPPSEVDLRVGHPTIPQPPDRAGIAYEDVVKGYEVEPGRFVEISREELEALRPEPTRTIEIEAFVELDQIDPVYFERSYYVVPQRGVGGERPYALLLRAMEEARKVGIGRFVLRSKEYLAAIRPMDGVLGLETLFFSDEVRALEEVGAPPASGSVDRRELDVAVKLIDMLATPWDPARYRDTYRERVLDLIESKRGTETISVPESTAAPTRTVADLMAALQASVEAVKLAEAEKPKRPRRRTG